MLSTITFSIVMLFGITFAQHPQQFPSGALGTYSSAQAQSQTQATTPKPYFPPAQVHYVNIGEDLAGDYKFGYDTGKSGAGQSFREESRLPDGTVKGAYGYIDAEGKQRIVKYTAGIEGFKVESDEEAASQRVSSSAAQAPTPVRTYSAGPVQSGQPQTITIRSFAPQPQLQPVAVRTYQATSPPTSTPSSTTGQLGTSHPSYRNIATSQPLGGYTSVAHTTGTGQPQYISALSQTHSQASIVSSGNQYSPSSLSTPLSSYEANLPSSQLNSAALKPIAAYNPQPPQGRSANQATLTAVLGQHRPIAYHLASIPRTSLSSSLSGSQYGSSVAFQTEQETTTWGPPVINKELLSYNIGVQQG